MVGGREIFWIKSYQVCLDKHIIMSKLKSFFLNTKLRQEYIFAHAGTVYFKTVTEIF